MAYNYQRHRSTRPWAPERKDFHSQNLLTPATNSHVFYHNLQLQGLHQTLGRYISPEVSHTFSNSATSSPLSTLSTEESPEHIAASEAADRLHSIRSSPSSSAFAANNYHQRSPAQLADVPIDLSKPKPANSYEMKTNNSSRLVKLLSRKRSGEHMKQYEQCGPLNLSKKVCQNSNDWKAVDMRDAVDNPVQLVCLLDQAAVADQVNQFLNQMIQRVFGLEQFHSLLQSDKECLVINCWHRLILWMFAENKFTFQVSSLPNYQHSSDGSSNLHPKPPRLNQPTMAFVRSIATFIKKYETLRINSEELKFLFAITLFHSTGDDSLKDSEKISTHRKLLMRQLHAYTMSKDGGGAMRYNELLLYLPMLYGVNGRMVEELFCSHLPMGVDVKSLLKHAIRSFSVQISPRSFIYS